MCNELLLKHQIKSFETETGHTCIPSVLMYPFTKMTISPPLVNIFSKIRMLRAGKLMLSSFLEHLYDGLLRQHGANIFFLALGKAAPTSVRLPTFGGLGSENSGRWIQ